MPEGPATYEELLRAGARIKEELGVQMGIGMSEELDSNLAVRAILWSFGASVQDSDENVTINSPESIAAVEYMAQLFHETMTEEVFNWEPASNNQGLLAGKLSYILNSISAYRTSQNKNPDVAEDVFFVPALKGPGGLALASAHVLPIYIVPQYSENFEEAEAFLLHLVANYEQATFNSDLYTFPAWKSTVPDLYEEGGWLEQDPFNSTPPDKLSVLKNAEAWTVNIGHPGPANPAIGEVMNSYILPRMVAKVARGDMTAEEAVADAESQIVPIFEKWRRMGFIGGTGAP